MKLLYLLSAVLSKFAVPISCIPSSEQTIVSPHLRGRRDLSETSYSISNEYAGLCWSVDPEDAELKITLVDCDESKLNQRWYYDPGRGTIKSTFTDEFAKDMCVTNTAVNADDLPALTLSECKGQYRYHYYHYHHQRWSYISGRFRTGLHNQYCISRYRRGHRVDVGDQVVEIALCDDLRDPDQVFELGYENLLRQNTGGYGFLIKLFRLEDEPNCLSFDPNDDFKLKIKECRGDFNEGFYFDRGTIRSSDGQYKNWCVVAGDVFTPMTLSEDCHGVDRLWSYDDFNFVSRRRTRAGPMCITHCNLYECSNVLFTKECLDGSAFQQDFMIV